MRLPGGRGSRGESRRTGRHGRTSLVGGTDQPGPRVTPAVDTYLMQHDIVALPSGGGGLPSVVRNVPWPELDLEGGNKQA